MSDTRRQGQNPRSGSVAPFEHVSAPVGRVLAKALCRAEARHRKNAGRRLKRIHKAKRRFWGCYAKWRAHQTDLNTIALSDAYGRYAELQALNSLRTQ